MQPVFNHQRRDRRDLDYPMTQWIWINTLQQLTAAATGIGVVFHHLIHHLIHPLDRQQFRPTAGMARLTAALAATALVPLWRLKPKHVTDGGLEELRELRPIRSRRFASSVARPVSCTRSSSFSCLSAGISCC